MQTKKVLDLCTNIIIIDYVGERNNDNNMSNSNNQ